MSRKYSSACKAKGCQTVRGDNLHGFRFPKDIDRCAVWVERAGNPSLVGVPADRLHSSAILCSRHFARSQFLNDLRSRLIWCAIPSIFPESGIDYPDPGLPTSCEPVFSLYSKSGPTTECKGEGEVVKESTCIGLPVEPSSQTSHGVLGIDVPDLWKVLPSSSSQDLSSCIEFLQVCLDDSNTEFDQLSQSPISPTLEEGFELETNEESRVGLKHRPRRACMTPRRKEMYDLVKKTRRLMDRLRCKCYFLHGNIKKLSRLQDSYIVRSLENNKSPVVAQLFKTQLKCGPKSSNGARWTLQEKVDALSFYKRRPKVYRLMETFVALPSPKVLINAVAKVPFSPGITSHFFLQLKEEIKLMKDHERVCSLMMCKMSLNSSIHYCKERDQLVGYEDYGAENRTEHVANSALVFMARGLLSKWKQPVAYFFCKNLTATTLQELIVQVIDKLQKAGLYVMSLVCDHNYVNRNAIRNLTESHKSPLNEPLTSICVNKKVVCIVFDPPHLLTSLRNAFVQYLVYWDNKVADWEHVKDFYEYDNESMSKIAPLLSLSHLDPSPLDKTKVNLAAQVFSHQVAAGIEVLSKTSCKCRHFLPSTAFSTALFIRDVDHLFDSFNGVKYGVQRHKKYRVCLHKNSIHKTFWPEMLKLINKWKFIHRHTRKIVRFSFQSGWCASILGVQKIQEILRNLFHQKYLETRRLNLDPLENLLCSACQHKQGKSKLALNCLEFDSALKQYILSSSKATHCPSDKCNCRERGSYEPLFTNLHSFRSPEETTPEEHPFSSGTFANLTGDLTTGKNWKHPVINELFLENAVRRTLCETERKTVSYVTANMLKKVDTNCVQCMATIATSKRTNGTGDIFNQFFSDYSEPYTLNRALPAVAMLAAIVRATQLVYKMLPEMGYGVKVKAKLTQALNSSIDFSFARCYKHGEAMVKQLISVLCRRCIYHFCKKCNHKIKSGIFIWKKQRAKCNKAHEERKKMYAGRKKNKKIQSLDIL